MCAQFMIRAAARKIALETGVKLDDEQLELNWNQRILPYQLAPVLVSASKGTLLQDYQFSLVPRWSKEHKVKFATHNARLEGHSDKSEKSAGKPEKIFIFEKPTWRDAFSKRHCVVPMSSFVEPLYTGKHAGHMVRFSQPKSELLYAAAIWEEWVGKDGEVVESFAIITDEPLPYVEKMGHDRSPVFISAEYTGEWLKADLHSPKDWVKALRKNALIPKLISKNDRPLKPGWEKRIPK